MDVNGLQVSQTTVLEALLASECQRVPLAFTQTFVTLPQKTRSAAVKGRSSGSATQTSQTPPAERVA
jgi:hypothetical protein